MDETRIGILYEHPLWFRPLFAELDRRGIRYDPLHANELIFDPGEREVPCSLVVNRMSPSAWTRGHAGAIFHSLHFLAYLNEIGAEVVNGHAAFQVEIRRLLRPGAEGVAKERSTEWRGLLSSAGSSLQAAASSS